MVEGRSMVNVIGTASELGYLNIPDNTLIEIEQMKNYPDEQMVLITTGSQGESMAALSRMAADVHKKVTIKPGDTVIFSSNPIPGNEKAVSKVINELSMKGADVIFQEYRIKGAFHNTDTLFCQGTCRRLLLSAVTYPYSAWRPALRRPLKDNRYVLHP